MKVKDMVPITGEQLDDIFRALDASREDIAGICGLSPHAPGRWRQSKKIPKAHLKRIGESLIKKFKNADVLAPFERRALEFIKITVLCQSEISTSKFDAWFKAQFGMLPENFRSFEEIHADLNAARERLNRIQRELDWAIQISQEYRAASYARNATEKEFHL